MKLQLKEDESGVIDLLRIAIDNSFAVKSHSWQTTNETRRQLVSLAIDAGFRFHLDDFVKMAESFHSAYWLGTPPEMVYRHAVLEHNLSAALSFEHWKKRKPFILKGKRLAVGSIFQWNDELVQVTSFNDESSSLVACSYEKPFSHTQENTIPKWASDYRKIKHRYTISNSALKEFIKATRLKTNGSAEVTE